MRFERTIQKEIVEIIRRVAKEIAQMDGKPNDYRYGAAHALNILEDEITRAK